MTDHLTLAPERSPRTGFFLLLAIVALVAAGKVVLADTLDPDCFWHLRVGDELARQGWPHPLVDDLSFASIRQPWTPYSWLAELGMKKLWDAGGFRAAIAGQAILESGFVLLLGLGAVEASRSAHGRPRYLASVFAVAVGSVLSLAYLSFRPVTGALTVLALVSWLLLRDRRKDQQSKAVWLVPPIAAVLINIHFFAILIPLWTGALLAGDVLERRPRVWRGALLFIASAVACCLTPMLPGMVRSILSYSTSDVMVHSTAIAEMHPFYQGTLGRISAIFVGLLAIYGLWQFIHARRTDSRAKLPLGELIWFAGSTVLLFRLGRLAPVFAIIAVPACAAVLPRLSDRLLARPVITAVLAAVLALVAWPVARGFPHSSQSLSAWLNRNGPDAPNYPCAAADFVEKNIPAQTHHLICEWTWGGYLEWRLGSQFQTLMDGRTQLFSPAFWQAMQLGSLEQRRQFLAATPADVAIVRANHSTLGEILMGLGWKSVYRDQFAEVLLPPGGKLRASAHIFPAYRAIYSGTG